MKGDAIHLRQVLLNLLNNAVKFTEKGSITLDIKGTRISENRSILQFDISDTGIGIEKDKQEIIFEKFVPDWG